MKDLKDNTCFESVACPVCGSTALSLYYRVPFGRLKQKPSLDYSCLGVDRETQITVSKCEKCRFVFTNPRVKAEYQDKIYNESKAKLYRRCDSEPGDRGHGVAPWTPQKRALYLPPLLKALSLVDRNGPLGLLDYGCGFGNTMCLARGLGMNVAGVDVDEHRLAMCRELGLPVCHPDDFRQTFPHATYDIVMCQSVIEHLIDLRAFLAFLDSISREGTVLYVNGVAPELIKREEKKGQFVKAHFMEHVNYFRGPTLDAYLAQASFRPHPRRVVLVDSRPVGVPIWLPRLLGIRKGFFQRLYIKGASVGNAG